MTVTDTYLSPEALSELRSKQQLVWSSGDYNRIAAITVPVAEEMVTATRITPGERVLDIATGTGHGALSAARVGGRATGIDYVPSLLEIARRRSAAEGVDVELVEAAAEELPFDDATFDVVVSAIGVMFSADHQRAADEIVRVTRLGGRIALASWTPTGFVGGMLGIVGRHVTPPAGAQSPARWGDEATVAALLGAGVQDVSSYTRAVTQRFASAEDFADLFLSYYGPTHMAARRLGDGAEALRHDLVEHARAHDTGEGPGLVTQWEYRVVTATRHPYDQREERS